MMPKESIEDIIDSESAESDWTRNLSLGLVRSLSPWQGRGSVRGR